MSIFDQVCSVMASDFVEGPTVNPQYQPPQPTQKPWVGLTDMDMEGFVKTMEHGNFLVAIYDIEKKLKEKNTRNGGCL